MSERLSVPVVRMPVVPIGIDVDAFRPEPDGSSPAAPVVGYLSRISEQMGAGLLTDAFLLLAREGKHPGLRLRLMGGSTASDRLLLRSIRRRFARQGSLDILEIVQPFGTRDRARFLAGLTVLSVPVLRGEAFGTFLLEAMACGVPVVQPRLGGFIEVVEETGGGMLYEPNTAEALAEAIGRMLADPERARALGRAGRRGVEQGYTSAHMAAGLEAALVRATHGVQA
jgi:glycosyltransferase involved in cell wall biosynthesis